MISPGWMPSRPRPLPRVRRGLLSYTPRYARRRRARRRSSAETAAAARRYPFDVFDLAPSHRSEASGLWSGGLGAVDLPVATLLASRSETRGRLISGHLAYWLHVHWAWLRPRIVPMIVAAAGTLAVLGATKYLPELCR